VISSSI